MKSLIFDSDGNTVNELEIEDDITFINGRVHKGKKHYYKGIGINYDFHFVQSVNSDEYQILDKSDIFYLGYKVRKNKFVNKFGIFQEQYQPQFSDFIGGCGVKELSLIENESFKYSSVKLIKSKCIDKINKQYYFELDYTCHRRPFTKDSDLNHLKNLVDYMISDNWNFPWDKNSIEDISQYCLVTDVADLFKSENVSHKLGSTYSILYSLCKKNSSMYLSFLNKYGLNHTSSTDFVFNSIEILNQNGICTNKFIISDNKIDNFKHIVLNHLILGKNCGDCDILGFGDKVRQSYIHKAKLELNV